MIFVSQAVVDNEKIDWHDYEAMARDAKRTGKKLGFIIRAFLLKFSLGIGEHGKPANISPAELPEYDKLYKVNGFNAALSDKIAVDRAVPDIRHKGWVFCFFINYFNLFFLYVFLDVKQKSI